MDGILASAKHLPTIAEVLEWLKRYQPRTMPEHRPIIEREIPPEERERVAQGFKELQASLRRMRQ